MARQRIRSYGPPVNRRHRRRRTIPYVSRPPWSVGYDDGYELYLEITDCVEGCGDHGQGTHSDNPEWRRDCFKSCTDTILANRAQ